MSYSAEFLNNFPCGYNWQYIQNLSKSLLFVYIEYVRLRVSVVTHTEYISCRLNIEYLYSPLGGIYVVIILSCIVSFLFAFSTTATFIEYVGHFYQVLIFILFAHLIQMSSSLKLSCKFKKKTSKFLYEIKNVTLKGINKLLEVYVFWKLQFFFSSFIDQSLVYLLLSFPTCRLFETSRNIQNKYLDQNLDVDFLCLYYQLQK